MCAYLFKKEREGENEKLRWVLKARVKTKTLEMGV